MKQYRAIIEKSGNLRESYIIKAYDQKDADSRASKLAKEQKAVVVSVNNI